MRFRLKAENIVIFGPNYDVKTLPETQYFALTQNGVSVGSCLPLPESVQSWNNATIGGVNVLAAKTNQDLYIIAEDVKIGFALFHYVCKKEGDSEWVYSTHLPVRVIQTERSNKSMANSLSSLSMQSAAARGLSSMNLGAQPPEMSAINGGGVGNDGIGGVVDLRRLQREAVAKSYVCGYIMGTAPAVTLTMHTTRHQDGDPTYDIIAKESKPSRPLGVLMAIPARCISKAGVIATPTDIMNGTVDFATTDPNKMIYQCFPISAAIGYISALGGKLAEYAPFVSDEKRHWSPEDILSGKSEVTYVRVHSSENKSRTSGAQEKFKFSLKTTSKRRSLYTQRNHICLRALEHMPTVCNTEEDAFNLNEAAFGSWKFRKPSTDTVDSFTKATTECPSQIWRKTYVINGEEHSSAGSAFFMVGDEDVNEAGEKVMKVALKYYPWWKTGVLRKGSPDLVESIVKRTLKPAMGDKKARMITHPVLWKDQPKHPMFKQYESFVDHILSQGYLTEDKLKSMGAHTSKARKQAQGLTSDQMSSLKQFLRTEAVEAAVQSVQDEAADRAILGDG